MKIFDKLTWAIKRLRVMNASEIRYRLLALMHLAYMRWCYTSGRQVSRSAAIVPRVDTTGEAMIPVAAVAIDKHRLAADKLCLLSGSVNYAGVVWKFTDTATVWRWTGNSATLWPDRFFAQIDYRPGNPYGDARVAWEPARLQHLYALSELLSDAQPDIAHRIQTMIETQTHSWITANPLYHGIHYVSAMECGLRIIAVAHTAANLERHQRLSQLHAQRVVTLIAQHAEFIKRKISRFSSAGNHTLAECAGLIYAGLLLRRASALPDYYHNALHTFVTELDRQVLDDGAGIECSTWYHKFNIDLAELVAALLSLHKQELPDQLVQALTRGGRFLYQLNDTDGGFVVMGDSDDGYALSAYHAGSWRQSMPTIAVSQFSDGGLSIVHAHGWRVVFDHGALGMAPGYGHGHADALSLVVYYKGHEIFCDTGTGRYSGNPPMRAYFRGTSAHNCVQLDRYDYARQETAFMWSRPYQCELLHRHIDKDTVELWGQLRVQQPVDGVLWRYVRVHEDALIVIDKVQTPSPHSLTLRWHIPHELVLLDENHWEIARKRDSLHVRVVGGALTDVQAPDQFLGYRSCHYGTTEAISTLQMEQPATDEHCFVTVVSLDSAPVSDARLRQYQQRAEERFHANSTN